MTDQVTVKLIKGFSGRTKSQIASVRGLGLRKIGSTRVLERTPAIMGMVNKVRFMLDVKEGADNA